MELSDTLSQRIRELVSADEVVLFMKGQRRQPQCGFSATVVEILGGYVTEFKTVDVLEDPELREGIKVFSSWPTIPQLYVRGEFVGGCDILQELDQNGELRSALGAAADRPEEPEVTISSAAAEAIRGAMADAEGGDELRLTIDARFHNDLSIAPREEGDIAVESEGITLLFDRPSARRAHGLRIDFVSDDAGTGFKIDNPNAPPQVQLMTVQELAERLRQAKTEGSEVHLYDVRSPGEQAQARIEGAVLMTEEMLETIEKLPRETPLIFQCHHGGRSQRMAEFVLGMGFSEVYNVVGGIDAWSQEIDPSVPRY